DLAQQLGDHRSLAGRDDTGPEVLRHEPVRVLGPVSPHVLPAAISTEGLAGPLLLAIGVARVVGGLHDKTHPRRDDHGRTRWRVAPPPRRARRRLACPN